MTRPTADELELLFTEDCRFLAAPSRARSRRSSPQKPLQELMPLQRVLRLVVFHTRSASCGLHPYDARLVRSSDTRGRILQSTASPLRTKPVCAPGSTD